MKREIQTEITEFQRNSDDQNYVLESMKCILKQ